MKTLNNNTQQAKQMILNYNNNVGINTTLNSVYEKASQNKVSAFNNCLALKEQLNGKYGCITSYNTFNFTYAFEYLNELKQLCLAYITKDNVYTMLLNNTKNCIL